MGTDAFASAECSLDHCITCGDEGLPMRVVAIDADRVLALCEDAEGRRESVEIALVEAGVGDELLVHAGTAIGRIAEAAA
jgi:hydrogenase expression/formation protein HypC